MKHFSYKAVLSRIQDETDLVDVKANEQRLKRLIWKAAVDSYTGDSLMTKQDVIDIKNGMGELPCDLIRLLRSREAGQSYTLPSKRWNPAESAYDHHYDNVAENNGQYIKPGFRTGRLWIAYYAVPTITEGDETTPAIYNSQVDYCAFYAICKLLRDDWARGKINANVYATFESDRDGAYHAALSSYEHVSIDDIEYTMWLQRNAMFYSPG